MIVCEMNCDSPFFFLTVHHFSKRGFFAFLSYDPIYQIHDLFTAPGQILAPKKNDTCRVSVLDPPAGWT